jgi:hypothetical protein
MTQNWKKIYRCKKVSATGEAFSPQKRTSSTFALLDPDSDSESGSGSTDLIQFGSETLMKTLSFRKTIASDIKKDDFDEAQNPDPHWSEKSNPDPHQVKSRIRIRSKVKRGIRIHI